MRLFEDATSFAFANPTAIRSPGAFITRPGGRPRRGDPGRRGDRPGRRDRRLDRPRRMARAGAARRPRTATSRFSSARSSRPSSRTEFDWEAARALAELNTRLRPGDLLGGPAARAARGRPERPARPRDRGRRHARRDRRLTLRQGYPPRHAFLPAPRRRSAQAAHPVPRQRHPAHRRGDGARGLHRQRVDPLPPPVALPGDGGRRLRADRARGVGAGDPPAPDDAHEGRRGRRRRGDRPQAADVERGRRDLALPPDRADGLLLPQRRRRRGDLRPRGIGRSRDDLRRAAVQGRRLRRHPARHHLPLPAGRRTAVPRSSRRRA